MLETWIQWTCDGCGATENNNESDVSKKSVRAGLKESGWRSYGTLDYCPKCVRNGNARRSETDMNH